jgi:catechol 2,3-dioxygenase-like lactoylglutathione lyase family enzyme
MNPLGSIALASLAAVVLATSLRQDKEAKKDEPVQLGNFCLSLSVKDVKASKAFYEKLGFRETRGKVEQNWVVMMNGTTSIALFQGFFEKNTLNFNPGWDWKKEPLKEFQDVREIQRVVKSRGLELKTQADEKSDGPASFSVVDPDGNPVLVDQVLPKPKR